MALKNQHLIWAKNFLGFLTWKKIFLFLLLSILAISISLYLINRQSVKEISINEDTELKISLGIRDAIDIIVIRSQLIIGIQVTGVDFQHNTRSEIYASLDNDEARGITDEYRLNKVFNSPLFSNNKVINGRLLRLIGGEFVCSPFKETSIYLEIPKLANVVTDVCSIAIPPYHSDFSGIFNIYLSSHPSSEDRERLFLLSRDISLKIFDENKYAKENHR